jgi:hypothetical protein
MQKAIAEVTFILKLKTIQLIFAQYKSINYYKNQCWLTLPRPQSLSKGEEENEKKLFVQYPIMHCLAVISQPLIYINCTALCPTNWACEEGRFKPRKSKLKLT